MILEKNMATYKFVGEDIEIKSFNSVYKLTDIYGTDLNRVSLRAAVTCNKSATWYIVRYKAMDDAIITFCIKSPLMIKLLFNRSRST